jgi:protein-arginine kinase
VPFYDEFVEKQLLAGNISNRHFTITLLSVNVTIPAADHVKAGSILHPTSSSQDLLSNLQSINEKVEKKLSYSLICTTFSS